MINNIIIDGLVDNLELKSTNVLIGANGAGKTRLLKEIAKEFNAKYYDFNSKDGFHEDVISILYHMYENNFDGYQNIIKTIQLIIKDVIGFQFKTFKTNALLHLPRVYNNNYVTGMSCIKKGNVILEPYNLSDGELKFINLVTLIMGVAPSMRLIEVMCFDNPDVGLHPYAINLLGALIDSTNTQYVIATHSNNLIDEFNIDDIIVVENENNKPTYTRLHEKDYENWLKEYSVSELWYKNVLGGRP
jgi:predicted ATPase